jgi:hypothetical protein
MPYLRISSEVGGQLFEATEGIEHDPLELTERVLILTESRSSHTQSLIAQLKGFAFDRGVVTHFDFT